MVPTLIKHISPILVAKVKSLGHFPLSTISYATFPYTGYSVPATDIDMDEVKAMFDVNVFAVMSMIQSFTKLLIASGDARIVNIGSIAGVMPYPFGSTYNASKAAVHAYSDTLRLELAPFG